ncbi:MAG: SGNH hydrolase domain-containing protein, partial [Solirubrobacteraceae bacterium]
AMDRAHPCGNLTRSVVPRLDDTYREPGSPCGPVRRAPELVCTFGTPNRRANRTIALVGDSHALHWRPALDIVARAKGWHAYSITTPGCVLSDAAQFLFGIGDQCVQWYRRTLAWLAANRSISIVFVSQRVATQVVPPAGLSALEIKIAGFRAAWRQLPANVRRVVVIRDVPTTDSTTRACIRRVLAARSGRPGPACRTRRADSVSADPAVAAVRARPSRRYGYVDLTNYFCSRRYCFPVIGGVLVHRDTQHLTAAYARTLGPLLLRKVNGHLARP